ncbi:hypothetical protein [Apibacter sp. HY039]|uniref:hypothetical protein n=1 Tax=Apibacter sp. HY039 TaxID=2501476 RepID=UPI000FEBEF72|nr:hypothetical protein [Apibacter sp. HY039]
MQKENQLMALLDLSNSLKTTISKYETKDLLTFISGVLLQVPTRNNNPLFKNLMSPFRQLTYLALLNLESTDSKKEKKYFSEEEWDEVTTLLHKIETEYFYILGFPKNGKETQEDIIKITSTLPTFLNYFCNGSLSFIEQDIEKIEIIFKNFNSQIYNEFNLEISDYIKFFHFTNEVINNNTKKALHYLNKENWQTFTSNCIEKGIYDPKDWINEAPKEILASAEFFKSPGSILKLNIDEIDFTDFDKDKFLLILNTFTCNEIPKETITLYTEKNIINDKPFYKINDKIFLPIFFKQYLNALYNHLFEFCKKLHQDKTYKSRDKYIENKTFDIFKNFFGKEAFYYCNYNVDNGVSEQDILILYKKNAFIIEVKATSNREPMRDFNKAYDKLKNDFKKGIQYGYDQCYRVKNKFNNDALIKIYNKNKKIEYTFNPKKYNVYTIVVTYDRFGCIQTNLSEMLNLNENDESYPWAVNIDDLETFLLALKKKKNYKQLFLKFIEYREYYHEHLICGDELELCGLFYSDENLFCKYSLLDEIIFVDPNSSSIFDKMYNEGLGFENERFYDKKINNEAINLYEF